MLRRASFGDDFGDIRCPYAVNCRAAARAHLLIERRKVSCRIESWSCRRRAPKNTTCLHPRCCAHKLLLVRDCQHARSRMPAKTTGSMPFKGETFPQYVLCRAARNTSRHDVIVSSDALLRTTTPPPEQPPTTFLTETKVEREPRRARTSSIKRPLRPSLSDQLRTISQGAQAITAQLASAYNLSNARALASSSGLGPAVAGANDKYAFQATTIGLSVGKLECRFPCPVTFAQDRCTYLFQHPFEAKEVLMIMYYRDMLQATVNTTDTCFRFRLSRTLEQFGSDYSPSNAQHWIRIVLATASEAKKVKLFLTSVGVISRSSISKQLNGPVIYTQTT